jgi:hypothetical protein
MLILAPLAYVGASLYNGQDPIQNIKNLFGSSDSDGSIYTPPGKIYSGVDDTQEEDSGDSEIKTLRQANQDLAEENKNLKIQIEAMKQEIELLKNPPAGDQ